jgi:HAD superfamily hydrolase (TIGR01509 family)
VEDGSDIAKECRKRVHDDLAENVPEKPGVHEIVEMFSKNGVKLAVASSSPIDMIRRNLTKTDLIGYFDVLVTGQGLEHGKPAPDIFLKAAEELGLDPADCYVFEDAFNGVTAGYAAGCRTIMIPDLQPPTEEIRKQAAGVYENLLAAKEAIENGEI